MITAKIRCTNKEIPGGGGEGTTTCYFAPDYEDGANKEWAAATPALHLVMTVKRADMFEQGKHYTLQFVEED